MSIKKLFIALLLVSSSAFANTLNIITTNNPGSLSDTSVRYFAPLISKELKKEVIVRNMPGADGLLALKYFLEQPSDGNTILAGGTSLSFMKYSLPKDIKLHEQFKPLMGLSQTEYLILVPTKSPIIDIKTLIEFAKAKGSISAGSSGITSSISLLLLSQQLKINILPIEYKQTSQVTIDLVAGDLTDIAIGNAANLAIRNFVVQGRLRPIAILGNKNSDYYKNVKTMPQQGYKPVEDFGWSGLFVHSTLPTDIKQSLHKGITAAMLSDKGQEFEKLQGEPKRSFLDSLELETLQKKEADMYKEFLPALVNR